MSFVFINFSVHDQKSDLARAFSKKSGSVNAQSITNTRYKISKSEKICWHAVVVKNRHRFLERKYKLNMLLPSQNTIKQNAFRDQNFQPVENILQNPNRSKNQLPLYLYSYSISKRYTV